MARISSAHIFDNATELRPYWTNRQKLLFCRFNPNGVVAKYREMCDTIRDFVDAGAIPSGWHLAYGSLSDSDRFVAELGDKKKVGSTELIVAARMLREHTIKAYNELGKELAGQ